LCFFLILVLSATPAYSGDPEWEGLSGDVTKGQRLFVQKGCMKCHTLWEEKGELGPDLTRIGQNKTLLQLAGLLWSHSPKMTELMRQKGIQRPEFTSEEMNDLISFLYSLNYFSDPGDPIEGGIQFSKKGCIICHTVSGKGGRIGPPLDKYSQYMSPILMAQAMWNHGPAMTKKMEEQGVKRPYFEGAEMTDLLAYIRSMSGGEKEERIYTPLGDPRAGEKLFVEKSCTLCHAVPGKGEKIGPDLGTVKLNKSITEIAGLLWNHGPKMWAKMEEQGIQAPQFRENEMSDLLAYLYFLHYMDPPGDPEAGKTVFQEKKCISCHTVRGEAKGIGPDLTRLERITSTVDIATTMWNHAPVMEKFMEVGKQEWPRFEENEMRDLVEYLRSIQATRQEK